MGVIKQKRTTQLQNVGVSRIQTGEADAAMSIAKAADNLSNIVTRQMQKVAQEKGIDYAEAVASENLRAFNENGEPVALRVPSGFGTEGARVYREIINRKYARLVDEDMRLAGADYAVKYPDPQQFTDQFSNYIANYAEGAEGRYKVQAEEAGTAQLTSFATNLKAAQQRGVTDGAASESLLQAYDALDNLNKIHKLGIITEENEILAKELTTAADTAITNYFQLTNNVTQFRKLTKEKDTLLATTKVSGLILDAETMSNSERTAVESALRNPVTLGMIEDAALRGKVKQIILEAPEESLSSLADMFKEGRVSLDAFSLSKQDEKYTPLLKTFEQSLSDARIQSGDSKSIEKVVNHIVTKESEFKNSDEFYEQYRNVALEEIKNAVSASLNQYEMNADDVAIYKAALSSGNLRDEESVKALRDKFGDKMINELEKVHSFFSKAERQDITADLANEFQKEAAFSKIAEETRRKDLEVFQENTRIKAASLISFLETSTADGSSGERQKVLKRLKDIIFKEGPDDLLLVTTDQINKYFKLANTIDSDEAQKVSKELEESYSLQIQNLSRKVQDYDGDTSPTSLIDEVLNLEKTIQEIDNTYFATATKRTLVNNLQNLSEKLGKTRSDYTARREDADIRFDLRALDVKARDPNERIALNDISKIRERITEYSEKNPTFMNANQRQDLLNKVDQIFQTDILGTAMKSFNIVTDGFGMSQFAFNQMEDFINEGKKNPYSDADLNKLVNDMIDIKNTPAMTTDFNRVMTDLRDRSANLWNEFQNKVKEQDSIDTVINNGPQSSEDQVKDYEKLKLKPLVPNLIEGQEINYSDPDLYFDGNNNPTSFNDELIKMASYGVFPKGLIDFMEGAAKRGFAGEDGSLVFSLFKSFSNSETNRQGINILEFDGPNSLSSEAKAIFGTAVLLHESDFFSTTEEALAAVVSQRQQSGSDKILASYKSILDSPLTSWLADNYEGADAQTLSELESVSMYLHTNITTSNDLKNRLDNYLSRLYFPDKRMLGSGGYGLNKKQLHKNSRRKYLPSNKQIRLMDRDVAQQIVDSLSVEERAKYYSTASNLLVDEFGEFRKLGPDGKDLNVNWGYEADPYAPHLYYVKILDESGAYTQRMIEEEIQLEDRTGQAVTIGGQMITKKVKIPLVVNVLDYATPTPLIGKYGARYRSAMTNSPHGGKSSFTWKSLFLGSAFRKPPEETTEAENAGLALMFARMPEKIATEVELFEKLVREGYILEEDLPFFSQYYIGSGN